MLVIQDIKIDNITYPTASRATRVREPLLPSPHQNYYPTLMSQQQQHIEASSECQIQLALQALKQDANLSLRRAAAIFNVTPSTLSRRRAGQTPQGDRRPKTINLSKLEEKVVVQHILDLDSRGFPPRLADVADMANSLRAERNLGQVG